MGDVDVLKLGAQKFSQNLLHPPSVGRLGRVRVWLSVGVRSRARGPDRVRVSVIGTKERPRA